MKEPMIATRSSHVLTDAFLPFQSSDSLPIEELAVGFPFRRQLSRGILLR